jgi:hypothetical protein
MVDMSIIVCGLSAPFGPAHHAGERGVLMTGGTSAAAEWHHAHAGAAAARLHLELEFQDI